MSGEVQFLCELKPGVVCEAVDEADLGAGGDGMHVGVDIRAAAHHRLPLTGG